MVAPPPPPHGDPDLPDPSELAAAWAGLEGRIEEERGVRGWLRRRRLATRASLAFGVALTVPGMALILMPRSDLASFPEERAALEIAALAVLAAGPALLGAWPLHSRPIPKPLTAAVVLGALGSGLAATLWPALSDPPSAAGHVACGALACGVRAMMAAVPVGLAARAVGRGAERSAIAAATLAGVSAFFALRASCADDSAVHGLLGHVLPIVFVGVGAVSLASWMARRRRGLASGL